MKFINSIVIAALLIPLRLMAATTDTSSTYPTSAGQPPYTNSVVILQAPSTGLGLALPINISNPLPVILSGGGSDTANQGTAAADSGSWPVHLVFGTTALSLGQALMASSIPVVISSNQSAIAVNDPGLPDTLGQKTSANSTGVVIASDQSTIPISGTVIPSPLVVTTTDRSGTITSGGVAQTAIALNASRKTWCIQNPTTATEALYVRINGTASATTGNSLVAGAQVCNQPNVIDTAAVSVFATTTSHVFTASETQ